MASREREDVPTVVITDGMGEPVRTGGYSLERNVCLDWYSRTRTCDNSTFALRATDMQRSR
jgi:hypothetical protein